MKKIVTYNVNGIRSALSKGLSDWILSVQPDILCIQELKAQPEQVDMSFFDSEGYSHYWFPAQKKGYSGVAIFSRIKPDHVEYGSGMAISDQEGRVIRADFGDVSVMSVYAPSGSSGEERQGFKMEWLTAFDPYIQDLRKKRPNLILAGDFNICHRAIDIHNPVSNANSSGFLPEERDWMEQFLKKEMVDTFRQFNPNPHQYTWWSFRANARNKNLGWRIDYQIATQPLKNSLVRSVILPEARHSDHCPVLLEADF